MRSILTMALASSLVLLAFLVPPASAGGRLGAGPVAVQVDDGFGESCAVPVAGFCFFDVEGSQPQDMDVDAYQRIDRVSVVMDGDAVRGLAPDLLGGVPDVTYSQGSDDRTVPNPVLPLLVEWWSAQEHPGETGRVTMTEDNVTIRHPFPTWSALPRVDEYNYTVEYGALGYDGIGPFDGVRGNSTDNYFQQILRVLCVDSDGEWKCSPVTTLLRDAVPALLPNVRVGLEFYDLHVTTDVSTLP